jgi:hypothetical protein
MLAGLPFKDKEHRARSLDVDLHGAIPVSDRASNRRVDGDEGFAGQPVMLLVAPLSTRDTIDHRRARPQSRAVRTHFRLDDVQRGGVD